MRKKFKFYLKKLPFYFIGMNIIGLAVVLIARAESIGSGGWDAVNINFTELINISLGTASIIVNATLLTILIIYRKDFKYLTIIGTILLTGLFIDFYDKVIFKNLFPNNYLSEWIFYSVGILLIPLGLALVLFSKYPSMIFDQITYMLMDIFKTKNFAIVRIGFEVFAVIFAIVIGLLAKLPLTITGIGAVGIGTIISSFILGPLINMYSKVINTFFTNKKDD